MLIGISHLLSPDLLDTLYRMGHGDELVLADAHFPGNTCNERVIRQDGLKIDELLEAIMPLFAIDDYVDDALVMMQVGHGDKLDPTVEERYRKAIEKTWPDAQPVTRIDRFEFYERAKKSFGVVMTGELAKYGNIIIKKGVTPV